MSDMWMWTDPPERTTTIRTVFILGLSSEIGREIGRRYAALGWRVVGSYRETPCDPRFDTTFQCDVTDPESVRSLAFACARTDLRWDVFIGAVGTEEPIGPFFDTDLDAWETGLATNATGVFRALHALWALRAEGCSCILFAGSGTNGAPVNYSAYAVSKILLIKMSEIVAAENPELNICVIGPGIVRTRIHQQTIAAGGRAADNHARVADFLASGAPGVRHTDIFDCVLWCTDHPEMSGRNLSLVHDPWREGGGALVAALRADPEMYRLRRSGNWR